MRLASTYLVHLLLQWPLWVVMSLALGSLRSWRRGQLARSSAWAAAAALAYALSVPALMTSVDAWLERQSPVPSAESVQRHARDREPHIVVLSGGWFRLTDKGYVVVMGTASWERTLAGVRLWRQAGGRLYFTGAPPPDGSNSVAREMAEVTRQMGVPSEQIGIEQQSKNTRENVAQTTHVFGLGLGPGTPVVLVTSAIHMPRALAAARAVGWSVLPYPCDFRADTNLDWRSFIPSNEGPSSLEGLLHELLGLLHHRWGGGS
jgi:uncharacterized SAM-binding protein YcdF (DUF218 family)